MDYRSYVRSEEWAARKKLYLQGRKRKCSCGATQVEVRHVSYQNLGNELDDDLHMACRDCWDLIHLLKKQHSYSLMNAASEASKWNALTS